MKLITVVIAISLLSACMKLKPKDQQDAENSAPEVVQQSLIKDVIYHYEPLEELNKYELVFKFASDIEGLWIIKTKEGVKNSEWVPVHNQEYRESVAGGEVAEYQFGHYEGKNFVLWQELEVKAPEDLLIDQEIDLTKESILGVHSKGQVLIDKYRRIHFTEKGKLITQGLFTRIEAEEITSESGLIASFPENSKAEIGLVGRSGGLIEIHAQSAKGTLFVELRGQEGGDGHPGKKPDAAIKGTTGTKGVDGISMSSGRDFMSETCIRPGTRGGPGGPGKQGYPGENGFRGGSTGRLLVNIKNNQELRLIAQKHPGRGGAGGAGGEGGHGGDGGPGGKGGTSSAFTCTEGAGPQGPQGPTGVNGFPGADGEAELICEIQRDGNKTCY